MGAAEGGGKPPTSPRVQDPPEGLTRARWLYVDEARSHEVHAGIRPGAPPEFVVREAAHGNVDPAEVFTSVMPLREPWEAQLQQFELETRLGLIGRYWRHDALKPGWTRLRTPPVSESLDLREVDVRLFPGDATFFHFHPRGGAGDSTVLVRLPLFQPAGLRFLLARAGLPLDDPARARMTLLHARLPVTPMRSVLAREHRELAAKGLGKLVRPDDFALAHGADWKHRLAQAYEAILDRIARGAWGDAPQGARRGQPVEGLYTDYEKWLGDPRVAALHARFLTPEEEAWIMSGGEAFIKQAIARKRAHASREDQLMLNLLEASLLARDGLRQGAHKVDPEVAALVRRFAYYL